ncbi:MAG: TolC family outer membrane protein [Pseudomonadota bacterium]
MAAPVTLQDAVRQAVATNPEVQARWHDFTASREEQAVARGGFYPRVDLSAGVGRENLDEPTTPETSFTRRGATLSLNQMLYDGFATREEVTRLAYAKLTRYYELLDATETTALEAARAYLDVLRYRELSRLAQENFAQHDQYFRQIQQRVQAGVGRRVDLEQAGGRLALAQSNLLTEASNLHDVSARYLRIVGELPPGEMIAPALLEQGIPPGVEEALKLAYQGSPAFNAALENVRAAQAQARGRKSNFHPRVDLRASKDIGYNMNGVEGKRDDEIIELVLNYNLFRGGSDSALVRQYNERLEQAKDLRDKACRDIRQTVSIAWKDIRNLQRQLGYLDQHQLATAKAREAYRKQFDIGQRTLLDLLDTENEYFQSRRAYTNAQYDHAIAHARTQAGMGKLLPALGVVRDGLPTPQELGQDRFEVDPASQCPAAAPEIAVADEIMAPRTIEATPLAVTAPPPQPVAPPPETVQQALAGWSAAWSSKDFPRYRGYYTGTFVPEDGQSIERWASTRAARLAKPGDITIGIDGLKVDTPTADRAVTDFKQTYASADYRDETQKRLEWVREDGRWKIVREKVLTPPRITTPQTIQQAKKRKAAAKSKDCVCD